PGHECHDGDFFKVIDTRVHCACGPGCDSEQCNRSTPSPYEAQTTDRWGLAGLPQVKRNSARYVTEVVSGFAVPRGSSLLHYAGIPMTTRGIPDHNVLSVIARPSTSSFTPGSCWGARVRYSS